MSSGSSEDPIPDVKTSLLRMASDTLSFYGCFFHFWLGRGRTSPYQPFPTSSSSSTSSSSYTCPYFRPLATDTPAQRFTKKYARAHIYSLASIFYLWDKPHYRKGSYRDDLADNLRNVAIPGTGVPLSVFVIHKFMGLVLVLLLNPIICFIAALHVGYGQGSHNQNNTNQTTSSHEEKLYKTSQEYTLRLLTPNDWFSYWRLNCRIAGLHSLLHSNPPGYTMENKWTFLDEGAKRGVPVSPVLNTPAIVVKHRNEEGGMGIFFYKNACQGGDWILQERIENSTWVAGLLPKNSPLSTFRVITQSKAALHLNNSESAPSMQDITALSCVFRAGREGAATDHDSILFNVNPQTGTIQKGTTNAHWYRLGLSQCLPGQCPWRSHHETTHHPDGNIPVTGHTVPDFASIKTLVEESHLKLCPDVPFVGWDVVLSKDEKLKVCLLEVNLSCNFFRGTFDEEVYVDFVEEALVHLHGLRLEREEKEKNEKSKKKD